MKTIFLVILIGFFVLVAGCTGGNTSNHAANPGNNLNVGTNQDAKPSGNAVVTNPMDDFAKCLTEKGAKFYGAYWCPHCTNQKDAFGSSIQYVKYLECATSSGQTIECDAAGIKSYPTWIFADGSRLSGELPFETLAAKTGCTLK